MEFLNSKWDTNEKSIKPMIYDSTVPIQAKRQVIFDKLLSPILWSSPIWAMNKKDIQHFQKKPTKILKFAIQGPISTPHLSLYAEFGIPLLKYLTHYC